MSNTPWINQANVDRLVQQYAPGFERKRDLAMERNLKPSPLRSGAVNADGLPKASKPKATPRNSVPSFKRPAAPPSYNTNNGGPALWGAPASAVNSMGYPGQYGQNSGSGSQYGGGAGQWGGYQQAYPPNAQAPQYVGPSRQLPNPYSNAGSSGSGMQQQQYYASQSIQQPPYYSTSAQYMPKPSTW